MSEIFQTHSTASLYGIVFLALITTSIVLFFLLGKLKTLLFNDDRAKERRILNLGEQYGLKAFGASNMLELFTMAGLQKSDLSPKTLSEIQTIERLDHSLRGHTASNIEYEKLGYVDYEEFFKKELDKQEQRDREVAKDLGFILLLHIPSFAFFIYMFYSVFFS